jgi:hypothetical protein
MSDEDETEEDDLDEDGDDEGDSDDGDSDDDGDGRGPPTAFDDDTEGRLIAGRSFEISGMPLSELTALKLAVDAIAERTKLPLDVVPGGDFTSTGPGPDDDVYSSVAIGLKAGRGGTDEPDTVDRAKALSQLEAARKLDAALWEEIAALVPEKSRERYRDAEIELSLVCVGPLAAATLTFGIEATKDAEGLPGKFTRGQNMAQESFATGVWGLRVAYAQYEGPEIEAVDLSDEAHAARVKELGRDDGQYFLVAQYD